MPQNKVVSVGYGNELAKRFLELARYEVRFQRPLSEDKFQRSLNIPKELIPELSENDCESIILGVFSGSTDYGIANFLSDFSKDQNIWKIPENLNEEDRKSYIVDRNDTILRYINRWVYLIGNGSINKFSIELKVLESYKKTLVEQLK